MKKSKEFKEKSIAIIGHMGSGKTLIGKLIAQKLNYRFFDSDKLIEENTQKSIKNIFKDEGESEFRKIEEKTIVNFQNKREIVLSLGGGAILSSKTRKILKNQFITVFLDTDFKILQHKNIISVIDFDKKVIDTLFHSSDLIREKMEINNRHQK